MFCKIYLVFLITEADVLLHYYSLIQLGKWSEKQNIGVLKSNTNQKLPHKIVKTNSCETIIVNTFFKILLSSTLCFAGGQLINSVTNISAAIIQLHRTKIRRYHVQTPLTPQG